MKIIINHDSEYIYSGSVFLAPHTMRFMPRSGVEQRVQAFNIRIDPQPSLLTTTLGVEGNRCHKAWFTEPLQSLSVSVTMQVETQRTNPFDYLPEAAALNLPVQYNDLERRMLLPYLQGHSEPDVIAFAAALTRECDHLTLPFLDRLSQAVNGFYHHGLRLEGAPQTPTETLRLQDGVCRDLALLYVECCREAGIAARFVSGYQSIPDDPDGERHLHAWTEVYIPGGGWRGYDPTHGLAVSDQHVVICASVDPIHTQPIAGAFSPVSGKVSAKLNAQLKIDAAPSSIASFETGEVKERFSSLK